MKIKTLAAALAFTCASGIAVAQDYQFEVGANFTNIDIDNGGSDDSFGAYGEYHFQPVRVGNNPLAEAAFINRSSHVRVSASDDFDALHGSVDFYIPDTIFLVGPDVVRTDYDGADTENGWGARFGLTPITGLLVWAEYMDEAGYDFNLNSKYVLPLGVGNFLNLEGGYADYVNNDVLSVPADFYFDQIFSVGVGYTDYDWDDVFELRARKFFTPEISGQVAFTKRDNFDTLTVGASFRF